MAGLKLLTVILLAVCVLESRGFKSMFMRTIGEPGASKSTCDTLRYARRAWENCTDSDISRWKFADEMLRVSQLVCKESNQLKQCVTGHFLHCNNLQTINDMLDATVSFCKDNDIPGDLKTFLESNAGTELERPCVRSILREARTQCSDEYGPAFFDMDADLVDGTKQVRTFYGWYINCFKTMEGLDEPLTECGGRTRRTVYAMLIASIRIIQGLGNDFYPEFKDMITPGVQDPLALALESPFYRK